MLLKKIVIAEDDDAIAHMVNMALGDAGFLCLRARDGEEALRLIRTHLPDLLVLDIMMPRMDGHEVARAVKSDVLLSKTPILMMTALGEVDQKVMGFESGADDYMAKPFDLREFNARVKALIRSAKREQARNPTTHLPGSGAVEEHVEGLLGQQRLAAVVRFDVVGFEDYSEVVGFARADELVASLGQLVLSHVRTAEGGEGSFVGHLGGVDFVAVCPPGDGEALAAGVIKAFQPPPDEGNYPLHVVAAVVTTEGATTTDSLAARMVSALRVARTQDGANYVLWTTDLE